MNSKKSEIKTKKESKKVPKEESREESKEMKSKKFENNLENKSNKESSKLTDEKKILYSFALKTVGWVLTLYLVVNLTLYFMGRISTGVFWLTMIVIGILTYKVIPKWRIKISSM